MQCRILFSSLVDKIEHTEEAFELVEGVGIKDVVDETVDKLFEELHNDRKFNLRCHYT